MSFLIENCRLGHGGEGSVYVRNGVIHRVSEDTTQAVPIETKRIEAGGNTLLPGLADTHCHPFELGWLRRNADLRGAANMTGLRMRLLCKSAEGNRGRMGLRHGLGPRGTCRRAVPQKGRHRRPDAR